MVVRSLPLSSLQAEFLSVTLSAATHVQLGVDSARSIVFHEPFMAPCHPNTVKLTLLDGAGSPVMGVTLQDIHFQLMGSSESPNCNGWTIGTPAVEGNTVTLPIAVEEFESAVELTRAVTLVGDISTTGFTSKLHVR